jgi:hypothetical protein
MCRRCSQQWESIFTRKEIGSEKKHGSPMLDREPEDQEIPLKSLRPFAAFALLVVALSLLYLIFRLVNS